MFAEEERAIAYTYHGWISLEALALLIEKNL